MFKHINLQLVKRMAKDKGLTLGEVAEKIGISYVGLAKVIRENSTTLSTIEKLSEVFDCHVSMFFMTEQEYLIYSDFTLERFKELKLENQALKKEIIDLKDKIIRLTDKF